MPTRPPILRVAVAGAGFAGLATAALLARAGHKVTVFEKFSTPQSVGAGILVQPSGLAAMRVLGIEQEVLRHGSRVDHLFGVTPRQRPVVNVRYQHWQPGSFGVGLHRGVLFGALWKLAAACGVTVVMGHEVRELSALHAAHDLVVVADGSRSSLRCQTGLACNDSLYPWGAVWAVLDDPGRMHGSTLWQWYRGASQMLGIMPTGCAPGREMPVVSLFWSLRADRYGAWCDAGLESFKRDDAIVLSDCLSQGLSLAGALERYTRLRRRHLHFYGQASRWLTPLFQSDLRLLPWLRDLFMDAASAWPLVGPLTRQTLVGMRQAWLSADSLEL